jgi:hypothetical protein
MAALTFYKSEEYQPFLKGRLAGSNGEFVLVAAEDMNKVANIVWKAVAGLAL